MIKNKIKKIISISSIICLIMITFSYNFYADTFSEKTQAEIEEVYASLPNNLKARNVSNSENIMIFDTDGKIVNEIHSDGTIIQVKWKEDKIDQVIDNIGNKTTYEYDSNGSIENNYYDNHLITRIIREPNDINIPADNANADIKRQMSEAYSKGLIDAATFDQIESREIMTLADTDYYVNQKRMNSLVSGSNFIYNESKAMTESNIQTFLTNKGSILKDTIKIYAINSKNVAYDTNRSVKPSTVIYNAAKNNKINPRIILVMLQKESSLISSKDTNVNRRALHYAMGYGATDSGDITTYTGFDNQVNCATKWLHDKYVNDSELFVYKTVNGGKSKTINGVEYKGEIYVDTYPAWVLYTYTPHVIDYALAPTIGGGNYLFLQVFEGWWSSWY